MLDIKISLWKQAPVIIQMPGPSQARRPGLVCLALSAVDSEVAMVGKETRVLKPSCNPEWEPEVR